MSNSNNMYPNIEASSNLDNVIINTRNTRKKKRNTEQKRIERDTKKKRAEAEREKHKKIFNGLGKYKNSSSRNNNNSNNNITPIYIMDNTKYSKNIKENKHIFIGKNNIIKCIKLIYKPNKNQTSLYIKVIKDKPKNIISIYEKDINIEIEKLIEYASKYYLGLDIIKSKCKSCPKIMKNNFIQKYYNIFKTFPEDLDKGEFNCNIICKDSRHLLKRLSSTSEKKLIEKLVKLSFKEYPNKKIIFKHFNDFTESNLTSFVFDNLEDTDQYLYSNPNIPIIDKSKIKTIIRRNILEIYEAIKVPSWGYNGPSNRNNFSNNNNLF